jgi:hypothetical protein
MKKVINGKMYDTETARKLAANSFGNCNDFNHWKERLYLKKTGEYFLYCHGGPLSKHATNTGDGMGWGEEIKPLSIEAAKAWAEKQIEGDEYEDIFGKVEE